MRQSDLIPLPEQVCAADPQPGTDVSLGTTVTLTTSKLCTVGLTSGVAQAPPARAATTPVVRGPGNGRGPGGAGPPGQEKAGPPGHAPGPQGDQGNGNGD